MMSEGDRLCRQPHVGNRGLGDAIGRDQRLYRQCKAVRCRRRRCRSQGLPPRRSADRRRTSRQSRFCGSGSLCSRRTSAWVSARATASVSADGSFFCEKRPIAADRVSIQILNAVIVRCAARRSALTQGALSTPTDSTESITLRTTVRLSFCCEVSTRGFVHFGSVSSIDVSSACSIEVVARQTLGICDYVVQNPFYVCFIYELNHFSFSSAQLQKVFRNRICLLKISVRRVCCSSDARIE
jgi:hypothetical protein